MHHGTFCVDFEGYTVEYAILGDDTGYPIVFFHGLMGSLNQVIPVAKEARQVGACLIAINRPGIGISSPMKVSVPEYCAFIARFLQTQLSTRKFASLGVSGGTPYALGMALASPNEVENVAIISGIGMLFEKEIFCNLAKPLRTLLRLWRLFPFGTYAFFRLLRIRFRADRVKYTSAIIKANTSEDVSPEIRNIILDDLKATLDSKYPCTGPPRDLHAFAHWGFTPEDLQGICPITWWHGADDTRVSHLIGETTARRMQAEFRLVPGDHLLAYAVATEVLAHICQQPPPDIS